MEISESYLSEINQFWNWFLKHNNNFGTTFENVELLSELDSWLNKLGGFSWEVGPGINTANQLVISPNGDLDLLPYTKEIVSHAMAINGWEFYYSKPPKQWDLIFNYESKNGAVKNIDASNWRYVLLRYDDGMFEIIIQCNNLYNVEEEDKIVVVEILLDGILGEENRISYIYDAELVTEFDYEYKEKSSSIKDLGNAFKQLI